MQAREPPGRAQRQHEEPCRDRQQGRGAERPGELAREPRTENRPQRTAHGDGAEQALALLQRIAVGHQRPEQHGGKQVEDAEPHVEHLAGALADAGGRQHEQRVERQQAESEKQVGRADEGETAEPAHQPAEQRIDQQRHDDGPEEQPADRLDAALHAQRLARRPHHHQRREHAEKEQPRDEGRPGLLAADVRKALQKGGGHCWCRTSSVGGRPCRANPIIPITN